MKKNRFFLIVTHQTRLARKIFIAPSLHKFLSKRDQTRKANRSHRLAGNVNRLVEVSQHISHKVRRSENAASQCHEKITFFLSSAIDADLHFHKENIHCVFTAQIMSRRELFGDQWQYRKCQKQLSVLPNTTRSCSKEIALNVRLQNVVSGFSCFDC